jgi:hypothetical protein
MDKIHRTYSLYEENSYTYTNLWKQGKGPIGRKRLRKKDYFVVYFTMSLNADYKALIIR